MANSNRDSNPTDTEKQRRFEKVFDDYVQRINAGETIDRREVIELYPDIARELAEQLEVFAALGSDGDQGKTLGDYTLGRQLGRGAMGIVYEA